MTPLTEREIRASFVNCTKGEASRMSLPHDLHDRPWPELDYLGWRDPQAPSRGYLVAELDGTPRGIVLRVPQSAVGAARKMMCSLCLTTRSGGVALMVAPRAGRRGQSGNTVGTYICSDLECSMYVRGTRRAGGPVVYETLTVEARVARLLGNLADFMTRIRATS